MSFVCLAGISLAETEQTKGTHERIVSNNQRPFGCFQFEILNLREGNPIDRATVSQFCADVFFLINRLFVFSTFELVPR